MSIQSDHILEEYLDGNSEISKKYREDSDHTPPSELDDKILAASRRAVTSGPRPVGTPFLSRWSVPISLAAGLMLTVGVLVQWDAGETIKQPTIKPRAPNPTVPLEIKEPPQTKPGSTTGEPTEFKTPDEWIAHIIKLKQDGKTEELRQNLVSFRSRFPDYAIPEQLIE